MSEDDELPRRLMTIMSADVVGYTKLTEADEEGTHRALSECLRQVAESIRQHEGKVVHMVGDGVLAQFPAAVSALDCAVDIQRLTQTREASGGGTPLRFRIGINVGDVIVDRGEIYGEAVNTAVRLQALAEPGGICISEAVRDVIGRRLPLAYQFIGEQRLKNISTPVRAYRALTDAGPAPLPPTSEGKPAIAVLAFENLSTDPEQAYFADGLTEDIIRELARFHGLVVIAHNSTFRYKGRAVKVQEIAEDLNVDFVVEGHLRRAGERLRISVQLVDARSGHHVWSEHYDRDIADVFAVQDDIVRRIVSALAGRIHVAGGTAALRRPSHEVRIYDHVLRGQALVGKGREQNAQARAHYEQALAILPMHARALTGVALSHIDDWWNGWSQPQTALERAFEAASAAYAADSADSKVNWTLALACLLRGDLDQSQRLLAKAIELNPNDADAFAVQALHRVHIGRVDEALEAISVASLLNPFPSAWYLWIEGAVQLSAGDPAKAEQALIDACERNPNLVVARRHLIAAQAALGASDRVLQSTAKLLDREPDATVDSICATLPGVQRTVRERIKDALGAAGPRRTK